MTARTFLLALGCQALIALAGPTAGARAGDKLLDVNWEDPDLKQQMEARAATRDVSPAEESPLEKLELPVFDFEQTPGVVTRGLGAQAQAEPKKVEHYDTENPVWYEIVKDYGNVTVTVEADRRVQHTFGPDFDIIDDSATRGLGPSAAPEVSVLDENAEEGMEGSFAEFTVYKAGIPYTVTIECSEETKAQCQDAEQIAKDAAGLRYIGGRPKE